MTTTQVLSIALVLLVAPTERRAPARSEREAEREEAAKTPIEIVVDTKPDWLFPGLDHPRVQAYFHSGSSVGGSLFDEPEQIVQRPLVRAGSIAVHGADDRAERTAARRFARELVADVRPALEACYADVLQRQPTDAARLVFSVELAPDNQPVEREASPHGGRRPSTGGFHGRVGNRGAVRVSSGVLGDVYGNACVHGVLEFADVDAPAIGARVDIPVWFWLQTM
jgi:hypothetical protein